MDDALDAFGGANTDFKHSSRFVCSDQHDEVVQLEYSDRTSLSVEHVVVWDPCLRALATITGSMCIKLA